MTETYFNYDDVVFACTHLCELLEVENEALAIHDPETIRALADNKAALARLYETSMRPVLDDPTVLDELDDDQRTELKTLGERLHDLVATNALRLKAEMAACQTVMDVIVGAVKEHAEKSPTYGRGGSFDDAGHHKNSISINKTL